MDKLPFVSVIAPAYNCSATIEKLINSLLGQTYPKQLFEIIIVDNNSKDDTVRIIKNFPVKLLNENSLQSSYAARNKGIKNAKGEVFAFIDSDCVATPDWIEEGIKKLYSEDAGLAGGKVEFLYSPSRTAAEIYDALTHLNMEFTITKLKSAGTANLFIRKKVFEKLGLFENVRSGGDMQFTHKAALGGYKLIFAPQARVLHPARTFPEVIKKSYRIGSVTADVLFAAGAKKAKVLYTIIRDFLPPSGAYINRLIKERGTEDMKSRLLTILGVAYLCRIVRGWGMVCNCGKLLINQNRAL